MSTFVDEILLRLSQQSFIDSLLTNDIGAQRLFDLSYDPVEIDVKSVVIAGIDLRRFGMPVLETLRITGVNERLVPSTERTEVRRYHRRQGRQAWVDCVLDVRLTILKQDLVTPLEAVSVQDLFDKIGQVNTLAELRTALETLYPVDIVDRFFDRFSVSSIEEFKRRGTLFITFVGEQVPPYDPTDPTAARQLDVNVCIQVENGLEVNQALQRAQLCRSILENEHEALEELDGIEVKRPYAFLVIFPNETVKNNAIGSLSADEIRDRIQAVFSNEGMHAHFV